MMRALLKTAGGQPDNNEHEDKEGQHENVNIARKKSS
jgi:hypothetical protein